MKRTHRKTHLVLWLVLAPAMGGLLWLAISHRPVPPINEVLPTALTSEVR
ncbi:MAG: hypothetical protein AAGH45_10460 [Pseudomonadota bacterium]